MTTLLNHWNRFPIHRRDCWWNNLIKFDSIFSIPRWNNWTTKTCNAHILLSQILFLRRTLPFTYFEFVNLLLSQFIDLFQFVLNHRLPRLCLCLNIKLSLVRLCCLHKVFFGVYLIELSWKDFFWLGWYYLVSKMHWRSGCTVYLVLIGQF